MAASKISSLVVAALLSVSALSTGTIPQSDEPWIVVDTGNFRLISNAEETVTRRLAGSLEELRAVLAEITGLRLTAPVPIHIIIFRNDDSFKPYKTVYQGHPAEIGGFYLRAPDAAFISISIGSEADAVWLIYHEYVHAVLADNLPGIPLWLSEGLAGFFESFTIDGDLATIGLPVDRFWGRFRESRLIPMEEFFAVDRQSPTYNEIERSGLFYFQSWVLVHHLVLGIEDDGPKLDRAFRLLGSPNLAEDEFRRRFEADAIGLEEDLQHYVRRGELPYQVASVSIGRDRAIAVGKVTKTEVLVLLGRLLAAQNPPRLSEAADHLQAALDIDPYHARAHAGQALLAEADGRLGDARAAYEEAIALDPDDGWIRYRYGTFLFQQTTSWSEAITALEQSLELDPAFGPTWAVLSAAYAERRQPDDDVLRVARHASRLYPSDPEVIRALIDLTLADDRRDEAIRVIDTAWSGDPRNRGNAFAMVVRNDLLRADEAIRGRDLENASTRLELARALLDQAAGQTDLALEIDATEEALATALAAARVEEAERLWAAGWTQPSLDLLEEIIAETPDQDVVDAAAELKWRILNPGKTPPRKPTGPVYPLTSRGEIEVLNGYLADGDFEAALTLLVDLDARVSATDRSWIDAKIDEIRRVMAHISFAEEYNRAVDALNDNDPRGAEAILSELLDALPAGPDADQARSLLDRIRGED